MSKKRVVITSLGFILLGIVYVYTVSWISQNIDIFMDTDFIAEFVLSDLIADTKSYFQNNWYYSTEIRVIYLQLIYVPLFWIFSDWTTIYIVGITICFFILLASFYFIYARLNLDICYYPYFAIILLCPISYEYLRFTEAGNYYTLFICISFCICGLLFAVFKDNMSFRIKMINYILALILGFVSSLGGVRMIMCLYFPMLIASVILLITEEKENILDLKVKKTPVFQFFILNICNIIVSGIGYVINSKILSKKYSFADYSSVGWSEFSFSSIEIVIKQWLEFFGYTVGEDLFIHRVLRHNIVCAFLIIIVLFAIVYALKERNILNKCLALIFCSAVLIFTILCTFTGLLLTSRYCRYLFPFAFLFIPLLACLFQEFKKKIRFLIFILGEILILMICFSINDYALFKPRVSIEDNQAAVEYLLANDLREGYSTGQALTFVSNGEIEVWWISRNIGVIGWEEGHPHVKPWLQYISHTEEIPGDGGKTFVAVERGEWDADDYYRDHFDMENLIFENDSYLIFGYESGEIVDSELLYKY